MERAIKFRALKADVDNPIFLYGQLVYDAIGQPRITEVDKSGQGLIFHTCLRGTEGQFTGLFDKNGKEIFDGDLLNIGANEFGFVVNREGKKVIYEVRVDGCDYILFRTDLNLIWGRISRLDEMGWDCEVIGNIFENAELLKK
jgi:hypothetical protein